MKQFVQEDTDHTNAHTNTIILPCFHCAFINLRHKFKVIASSNSTSLSSVKSVTNQVKMSAADIKKDGKDCRGKKAKHQ